MNKTLLYIGDSLLDLFDKSVLAITYQLFDIRDLVDRRISFGSAMEFPSTPNNNVLLGNPQNVKSGSAIPYQQTQIRCLSRGVEYFKGRLDILEGSKTIKGNLVENLKDIFEQIGDKKLVELGYLADSAWLAADIDAARLATDGAFAPVINWGQFLSTPAINSTLYLPSYFYKEAILAILESTGYTFQGDALLNNSDINDLIMPFSNESFAYVKKFEDDRAFYATFIANQQITTSVLVTDTIELDQADPDGLYFNTATGKYEIPVFSGGLEVGRLNLYLDVTLDVNFLAGANVDIEIRIIGTTDGTLVASGIFTVAADSTVKKSISILDIAAYSGDDYYAEITIDPSPGATVQVTITPAFFYGGFTRAANRNFLFHNYLLPDIKQVDLLKDFFVRIGGFTKLENDQQTVTIKTLNEILGSKYLAKDWTAKRVKRDDKVAFNYQSYTQNNYFRYKVGDGVVENMGRGNLPVNNENLETESDYFESLFENCLTLNPDDVAINMAYIPVFDGTSVVIEDFVNPPGLKLLTVRAKGATEPDVTFNAVPRGDYKVAYFTDANKDKDTGFQYFIDTYYSFLVTAFDKTKLITRDYILLADDVSSDVFIIEDSGNYFLVNKIPKFIPDKITENVELLRIF